MSSYINFISDATVSYNGTNYAANTYNRIDLNGGPLAPSGATTASITISDGYITGDDGVNLFSLQYNSSFTTFTGLENLYLENVTSLAGMFAGCTATTGGFAISNWKTSTVENFKDMFSNSRFEDLSIGSWNVCNATNMDQMFLGSKFNGDLSNWKTPNIDSLPSLFDLFSPIQDQTHLHPQWGKSCEDSYIGDVIITGPAQPYCRRELVGDFTATYTGTAQNVKYQWVSSDPDASWTNPYGPTTKIQFGNEGTHTVDCKITNLD